MAEIVNNAVIKVEVDASGVEAGLSRVEQASVKTGRTIESLGRADGFNRIGEGAGAASDKIDRSTKSMAEAIQRATAAMQTGAKGSAEYYAALANQRGLNIAVLKPYLDQLDQVTRKTAAAAEAQRQMEAGNRFLEGLRAQTEGIGKTASQLALLRAEQLGVADAARPFIEQMRAAEEAASNAGGAADEAGEAFSAFSAALAAAGLGAGIASISELSDQYGKYVSQLELATTGQTEFVNAQNSVRRIATTAQSDLSATASLYANITNGARDLGLAQKQIADITETVSLALKVSGASGAEASSAILQLSQAFASGTLRGDEFNSVAEAAPRLMQALADGLGVPAGALRKLAEDGELTTAVLAQALPRALGTLREEAQSVNTVAGSMAVLKNNVLEMVGATAQSSGVVSVLSGGINLLADNLTLAAGAAGTFISVKLGTALVASGKAALDSVVANRALAASNLATANSNVAATAAAAQLATARVAELRAATLAAQGEVALAVATNGLIPAQARATAAAAAHTEALAAQAVAARAASVSATAVSGAMALLGGPVGLVITLLGAAATAWAVWGDKAEEANKKVGESTEETTVEMIARLDKQIEKLQERNKLLREEPRIRNLNDVPEADKDGLARAKAALDAVRAGTGQWAGQSAGMRQLAEIDLLNNYEVALARVSQRQKDAAESADLLAKKNAGEWMQKYATNAEKLEAELTKVRKDLNGTIPPELEARIRKQFEERATGAGKEVSAYKSLAEAINERVAATAREAAGLAPLTEAQKLQAKLDADVLSGRVKLTATQKAYLQSRIAEIDTNEGVTASQKRAAQGAAEWERLSKEIASNRARSIADAVREADRNEELARTFGMTRAEIERSTLARLEDQLAQRSSLGLTLDEIEALEQLIEAKRRSVAAIGSVEAQEAAKKANEAMTADWSRTVEKYEDVFRQGFADMLNNGKDGWKSFTQSLVTTFKTTVADQIYKMFAQKFVVQIAASVTGQGGSAGALSNLGGQNGAGMLSSLGSLFGSGSSAAGTGAAASGSAGASSGMGGAATYAGWIAVGMAISKSMFDKGWNPNNGSMQTATYNPFVPIIGESLVVDRMLRGLGVSERVASMLTGSSLTSRLFGRRNPEITAQGFQGTLGADGFSGGSFADIYEKGGLFRSSKRYTKTGEVDAELDSYFDGTIKALMASAKSYGEALGLPVAQIDSYTKSIKLALTDDEAKNQEAIAKLFGGIGDELSTLLVPTIAQFSKAATEFGGLGETASQTLQRIATNYVVMDEALRSIGDTFGAVGLDSVAARERLLELTGGLESFSKGTAFFAQNFLTEAERLAPVQKSVADSLASMGLSWVDTRDEFKNVVLGLDLTSEAGAKTYASLMGIQEQFAMLYPAIDLAAEAAARLAAEQEAAEAARRVASEQRKLDIELMKALGNAEQALAEERKDTLASLLSDAARVTQAAIYAAQDAAKAAEAAIEKARASATAQAEAFQAFGQGLVSTMDRANEAAKALRDYRDALELGANSPLDAQQQRDLAAQQFEAKPTKEAADALLSAAQALRNAGGTQLEYARDFAKVQLGLSAAAAAQERYAASIPAFYKLIMESGVFGAHGSHASGLARVPFDGYRAILHEDEAVLTKSQAQAYRAGITGGGQSTAALEAKIEELGARLEQALAIIADSSSKTADAIDDIATGRRVIQTESA